MPPRRPPSAEFALIDTIRHRFADIAPGRVALGIGDDCAIVEPPPRSDLLLTTDLLLEGCHFRRDLHPAASAGHRCLARGLSDLAAMGAMPLAAFLSLALPPDTLAEPGSRRWLNGFLGGMSRLARTTPVPLAGGDTGQSSSPLLMADIVLLGHLPRGTAMRRDRARPGDLLYVTGSLGGAAAELERMQHGPRTDTPRSSRGPQQLPKPRLAAGIALRERGVRAAIDLSDGLSGDLAHLVRASGVQAVLDAEALPLHPLLRRYPTERGLALALHGGEDYELLLAASPRLRLPPEIAGVCLTRIGRVEAAMPRRAAVSLAGPNGRLTPLRPAAWEHFTQR